MLKIVKLLASALLVTIMLSVADAEKPPASPADDNAETRAMEAQLDRKLPEVKFDAVSFSDVADFMRDVTGANLVMDWKGLEKANIDRNAPVTLNLKNEKFRDVLQAVCDSAGKGKVAYRVTGGVVVISSKEGVERIVSGLEADHKRWDEATQKIMLRRLPEVSFDGVGLSDVSDFLRDVSGQKIAVDWPAFEKLNVDRNAPVSAKLRNIAFGDALHLIFQSATDKPIQVTNDNGVLRVAPAPATQKTVGEDK